MLLAVAAVFVLGVWDAKREFSEVLERLAVEQHYLAQTIAHDVASRALLIEENARLRGHERTPSAARSAALEGIVDHLKTLKDDASTLVLVHVPGRTGFQASDGRVIVGNVLQEAIAAGEDHMVLEREETAEFGYAYRAAVGFASVVTAIDPEPIQIAVISAATHDRERRSHAEWRVAIVVLIATLVAVGFGARLLTLQARELQLASELGQRALEAERDELLARAERFSMLAALSTGIAHELSTPLTVVMARLDQLASLHQDDAATKRVVQATEGQVERMRSIIRGFLALARGEAPVLERISSRRLVEDARELVEHRFLRADVVLTCAIPEDAPDVVCDPPLFVQVLVNLSINACHASRPGGRVTVAVDAEGGRVDFVVTDEGTGIERDVADKVKEPFFTTRAQAGGTGLGLAIASEIVHQHGGTLTVDARVDAPGTRAVVGLPAPPPASRPRPPKDAEPSHPALLATPLPRPALARKELG